MKFLCIAQVIFLTIKCLQSSKVKQTNKQKKNMPEWRHNVAHTMYHVGYVTEGSLFTNLPTCIKVAFLYLILQLILIWDVLPGSQENLSLWSRKKKQIILLILLNWKPRVDLWIVFHTEEHYTSLAGWYMWKQIMASLSAWCV